MRKRTEAIPLYYVCTHCTAKFFHAVSPCDCPRCGQTLVSTERIQPPWRIKLHTVAETAEIEEAPAEGDAAVTPPKKKTRRGSRGGKNRKKKPAVATNGAEADLEPEAELEPEPEPEAAPEPEPANGEWEYRPMSEWADEIESNR